MQSNLASFTHQQVFAHVATQLRVHRERTGMSACDVHARTGIAAEQLTRLESGTAPIHAAHILKLSHCYAVTPNDLFVGLTYQGGKAVSEEEAAHLVQNFLKVDQPARGQLFKDFVSSLRNAQD